MGLPGFWAKQGSCSGIGEDFLGKGGITIPGSVEKVCGCGTSVYGLVVSHDVVLG